MFAEGVAMESVVIQWDYTPADYFPAEVSFETKDAALNIHDGKIAATLKASGETPDGRLVTSIRDSVEDVFIARQLRNLKEFHIQGYSMQRTSADGKKHTTVFLQGGSFAVSGAEAHMNVRDSTGKIISDSRADQVNEALKLASVISARNRDNLGKWIVERLRAGIADKTNELVHYYDVLDAVKTRFGGNKTACKKLGIAERTWSRLGDLANTAPLLEGRHRGLHFGRLRKATSSELSEARSCILEISSKYLEYSKNEKGSAI
jgi:hypothetical protein